MNRLVIFILSLFILNQCSYNENSSIWNKKEKELATNKNIKKILSEEKKVTTEFNQGLTVHPNPVKDNINISFYLISELTNPALELYDAMGRLVSSKKLNHLVSGANEIEMSSSNLDAGWYLLVLKSQEKTITNKFLKK